MKRCTNAGCDDTRMELIFKMKSKKNNEKTRKTRSDWEKKKTIPWKVLIDEAPSTLRNSCVCVCISFELSKIFEPVSNVNVE